MAYNSRYTDCSTTRALNGNFLSFHITFFRQFNILISPISFLVLPSSKENFWCTKVYICSYCPQSKKLFWVHFCKWLNNRFLLWLCIYGHTVRQPRECKKSAQTGFVCGHHETLFSPLPLLSRVWWKNQTTSDISNTTNSNTTNNNNICINSIIINSNKNSNSNNSINWNTNNRDNNNRLTWANLTLLLFAGVPGFHFVSSFGGISLGASQ